MSAVTLYHGTSEENADMIRESGFIEGPVFLTPCRDDAEEYSDGGEVFAVSVNSDILEIDFDLPGAKTMKFDDAKAYKNADWDDIHDALADGVSVAINDNVSI
ncbi:hypothetical protein [uncultured Paraglaciecola sp.]|uniref:hypothetical protein n=1 Tax=uncultured Paraglaciecola sp. TaxID=1765024 RepID=UPI00262A9F9C|nr:hypothetical protein [uncultured Paraglaciecola sp.]